MPEPAADFPSRRYAILHHQLPPATGRQDHFDLLLEWNGVLLTWELPLQPLRTDGAAPARRLPDHRLLYLDYSGPLSDHRGEVQQVDAGLLEWLHGPDSGVQNWSAVLAQPQARWRLSLTAPAGNAQEWVVEWRRLG